MSITDKSLRHWLIGLGGLVSGMTFALLID